MMDYKQQVFFVTTYMNDFVLTVVVALPSYDLKFTNGLKNTRRPLW